MNNTTQFVKGFKLHENVDEKFLYGDVYFIDTPYICEKKDLNKVNTRYLAGCRPELIVSSDDFNKSSSFRYTVPISTYHEKTTTLTNEKILFKDINGRIQVLHLDEMRTRHTSDIVKGGESKYCYHMSKEFMNMITEKITEFTGNKFSNAVNTELNEKIMSIESKLDSLLNLLNHNSTNGNEKDITIEKDNSIDNKTTKNRSTKFDRWSGKKKEQFKYDLINMTLADISKKYKISVSSIQRYIDLYFPELRVQRKTEREPKKKTRYFKYVGTKSEPESQIEKFNRRWNKTQETCNNKSKKGVLQTWDDTKKEQFVLDIKTGEKTISKMAQEYDLGKYTVNYYRNKYKKTNTVI